MSDNEEKTRVTTIERSTLPGSQDGNRGDCLVVIYTKDQSLLGKRFVLEHSPMRVGRGSENSIILEGDSISRRHAYFEQRETGWFCTDDGSTNGTFVNDEQVEAPYRLQNGDRVKIGSTILKYLTGHDVESQYHEEIYRMTIIDGLTQAYVKRYLLESLEKEIIRSRRHERPLSLLMFDIDFFKKINDNHGHLAGDEVLKAVARVVRGRVRRNEVFARYGGEEFAVVMPETTLDGGIALAEELRAKIESTSIVFQGQTIRVTVSLGVALLLEADKAGGDLIRRADEKLYEAKRGGRNRVVG